MDGPAYVGDVGADGAAVRLWSRSELRRRWPALILLGVLGGLAAGLAMAAVDGANRTETAYERMRTEQLAADVVFFPSQVGVYDLDVTRLSELPEVAAWAGFASTYSVLDEVPDGGPLVPVGSDWFTTIERATVLDGPPARSEPRRRGGDHVRVGTPGQGAGPRCGFGAHLAQPLAGRPRGGG